MRPASEVAAWQAELDGLIADVSLAVGKYVRACERSSGMADEPERMRKAQMNLREWVAKLLERDRQEVRAAALEEAARVVLIYDLPGDCIHYDDAEEFGVIAKERSFYANSIRSIATSETRR